MKRSDITHHDLKEDYEKLKPILAQLPKREFRHRPQYEKDILKYIRSPVQKYNPKGKVIFIIHLILSKKTCKSVELSALLFGNIRLKDNSSVQLHPLPLWT